MKTIKISLLIATCAFVALWLVYVWPTPWNHYTIQGCQLRVNRFTGSTQALTAYGWHTEPIRDANGFEIVSPSKRDIFDTLKPNPYDDLPMATNAVAR